MEGVVQLIPADKSLRACYKLEDNKILYMRVYALALVREDKVAIIVPVVNSPNMGFELEGGTRRNDESDNFLGVIDLRDFTLTSLDGFEETDHKAVKAHFDL